MAQFSDVPMHLLAQHLAPCDIMALSSTCKAAHLQLGKNCLYWADQWLGAHHAQLTSLFAKAKLDVHELAQHTDLSVGALCELVSWMDTAYRRSPWSRFKADAARLASALVVRRHGDEGAADPRRRPKTLRALLCVLIHAINFDDPNTLCMRPWLTLEFMQYVVDILPHVSDALTLGFVFGMRHLCADFYMFRKQYSRWLDASSYKRLTALVRVVCQSMACVSIHASPLCDL